MFGYVLLSCLLLIFSSSDAKVFFSERFNDDSAFERWVNSTHKAGDLGALIISAGKTVADPDEDAGLKTSQDAKFYDISAKFDSFSNKGKKLCVQMTVKHEQDIDCGGGYIKLLGADFDGSDFHGETPYNIMFGPDICGMSTRKVHVIFNYKGQNHLIKKDITCKTDALTHLYTLIVSPDNTYQVLIDNEQVQSGSLADDWDMLPPKKISDPAKSKPTDWIDVAEIDDPKDEKPEDWEKPKTIPDANAKKPDDWDDDMDGEWEIPMIDNPEYKGDWSPKKIPNPEYKGEWVHPQIDNPDFKEDSDMYAYTFGGVGIDIWQVKSGTIFDNLLITDDPDDCKKEGDRIWKKRFEAEKKAEAEEVAENAKKAETVSEDKEDELDSEDKEDEEPSVPVKETRDEL